jgi:alcohol dehydrogenase
MPFRVPTHLTLEPGCFAALGQAAAARAGSRVALVSDPGLAATPWPERARQSLRQAGLAVTSFDQVEPNPRDTTAERLAETLRADGCQAVIGLGGGSVLDAAKAAAMLATNGGCCADYVGRDRYRQPPLPLIAVPTTCGTGSEVTWVSVISVEATRSKISVKGETMFPAAALVDADLIRSLPPAMVAATGADALTHALEATTGRCANPASDALAERAIELLLRFLPRAVANVRGDDEARNAVMEGSTLAGLAFGNADVGAVHCLSESLGGLFDVPHGLTNALLLVPTLRAHGDSVAHRLAALAPRVPGLAAMSGAPAPEAAAAVLEALAALIADLALPPFASLAIPAAAHAEIATAAVANGSNPSNPRPMGEAEYLAILAAVSS